MALRRVLPPLFLALPVLGLPVLGLPAHADGTASAAAIRAALVGNTVEGSMAASGGYAEFYAPDGSIHATDYTGAWAVKGNKMCFVYGDDPENCWSVMISGARVVWLGEAGEEGFGTIKPGNPGGW